MPGDLQFSVSRRDLLKQGPAVAMQRLSLEVAKAHHDAAREEAAFRAAAQLPPSQRSASGRSSSASSASSARPAPAHPAAVTTRK